MSSIKSISLEKLARLIGGTPPPIKPQALRFIALCALLLAPCEPAATRSHADSVTFAASKGLGDLDFAMTGNGVPGEWSVVRDDAAHVLAQTSADPTEDRFPLAIYRPFSGRNVYVSIRFAAVSGNIDRAGGVGFALHRPAIIISPAPMRLKTMCGSTAWSAANGR
jgi:hypothetical protein